MKTKQLQLASIQLKDFRCFSHTTIDLNSPIVLICGSNGTGKTSLLEALYYGCYLRSFRTHLARDLIALEKESFFIKLLVSENHTDNVVDHTINIGFTGNKRRVTVDNKAIVSYKDLLSHYRIVSLTEDDLKLVQDGPEERRAFLDQALLLDDSSFLNIMREYRIVLDNRNALFQKNVVDKEAYSIWTGKLWELTQAIQQIRRTLLQQLEAEVNRMLHVYIDQQVTVSLIYQAKKHSDQPLEAFLVKNPDLIQQEIYFKRSLFGAHIDDFTIVLGGKRSRAYASRGQQKMIVLLVKIAQIKQLTQKKGPIIFLLDDFMTDFDAERGKALLSALLELDCQLIFTSPRRDSALESALITSQLDYKIISM
jgi:DNA replication and repair protein RecF